MSGAAWVLVIGGAAFVLAAEVVILILRRRTRQKEAAFGQDFSAQMDRELPGFFEGESE